MTVGLLTLRLATQHLTPEELGIWNFVFATVSYFALLELGLGPGIARLLGEPLADGDQAKANALFTTGLAILCLQAGLFLALGWVFRESLLRWGGVPPALWSSALALWTGIVFVRSLTLPLVLFNGILWAQNRVYWIHLTSTICPWIGLGVFALALGRGDGLLAYLWSVSVPAILTVGAILTAVIFGPHTFRLRWKGLRWRVIAEILSYSWAVFAASGAAQLSSLSQMVIVTRVCGLEAAGVFGVTSRIPSLLIGVITRPFDSFIPRWSANYCLHGIGAVKEEFVRIMRCSLMGVAAVGISVCLVNPSFVRFWTRPEFYGGSVLNTSLAFLLLYQMISRGFSYAFTMRKQMTGFAVASLASVVLELTLQILGASLFGLPGVIIGYLAAVGSFLIWYILKNGCRMLEVGVWDMLLADVPWWMPSFLVAVVTGFYEPWLIGKGSFNGIVFSAIVSVLLTAPIVWRIWVVMRRTPDTSKARQSRTILEN